MVLLLQLIPLLVHFIELLWSLSSDRGRWEQQPPAKWKGSILLIVLPVTDY
jgi:hypothetical protein